MKFQYRCKYLTQTEYCIQNTFYLIFFSDNYNNFAVIKQLVSCYGNYHILLCLYAIYYESSIVFHDVAMRFFTPAQQHISAPLCNTFPARQQQHISAPLTLVIMAICCYNERYDNMRRCRNDAFIETCCDKLACYNFAMIIYGVAAMLRSLKHAATSLHAIIIPLIVTALP